MDPKKQKRIDYPLCPYCESKVVAFVPPGRPQEISLYCSSAECKGMSRAGVLNGYDIMLNELSSPVWANRKADQIN
jgi:hypothetical protein